jgi:MarR family
VRPDELAARSRAAAAENDAAVLAALTVAGDEGLRPGELASAAALAKRTASEAVRRLAERGLVRRDGKRRLWATAAGRSEAGAGTPGLELAPALDATLACFPAEAQRAFARLLLSAVPARWHLANDHIDGWAGFIALGPSKTGKTSLARLACRVYGLDELEAITLAQDETRGSLLARREPDRESATGYRVRTSSLLELPFACIDEWDKAPEPVRSAASRLLLGHTAAELEGERLSLRPTVLVCLNTGREGLRGLHEAHVRRSVVLDTTPLGALVADIDVAMHRLFASNEVAIPRLTLARLRHPAGALPDELRQLLRDELRAGLTEEGWRLSDVEPLARIALGRAALAETTLEQAVLATALDYLSCAATVGHARPGFAARIAPRLGADGLLVPDAGAAEAEAEHRRLSLREQAERTAADRLRFQHDRERRAGTIVAAREALGRPRDPEGKAISKALGQAAKDVRGARGADALEAASAAAQPYLESARRWKAAQEHASAERRRAAEEERRRRELERKQRLAEREWWKSRRSALGALVPYESPSALMAGLARLGLVRRVSVPAQEHPNVNASRVKKSLYRVLHPGYPSWQDAAGRTLAEAQAPALWAAHYREADERVRSLGGRSRPKQPKQRSLRRVPASGPARAKSRRIGQRRARQR